VVWLHQPVARHHPKWQAISPGLPRHRPTSQLSSAERLDRSEFRIAWRHPMHEIFLSYSRRDSVTVQALASALSERGLVVWVDRSGIEEGDAYDTQIEDAIAQTRVVIVLWSKNSVKSQWVRAEAAYALGKHKLLPISIDRTDPPLQFLHIQTIDFDGWQGGGNGEAFARLLAALSKRLDRRVVAGQPTTAAAIATPGPGQAAATTKINGNWLVRTYHDALVAAGLRFPEKVIEKEFQEYFRERTYVIAQFAILLAFIAYVVYGVSDMATNATIASTRFRFMVACPLLLIFYWLSFKQFAKRRAPIFLAAFAVALSICVYITVLLLSVETPFQIRTGNGTMNFMLTIGLLAMLPLSVVTTALIGLVMMALHATIMMGTHVPLATSWLNYLHLNSMWGIACCIAYWREHQLRVAFAAEFT
jgi:TIR domain